MDWRLVLSQLRKTAARAANSTLLAHVQDRHSTANISAFRGEFVGKGVLPFPANKYSASIASM
jgi:hypothetical protein